MYSFIFVFAAMGKKRKHAEEEEEGESSHRQMIPAHVKNQEKRLIVVLERANLESVKVCIVLITAVGQDWTISHCASRAVRLVKWLICTKRFSSN